MPQKKVRNTDRLTLLFIIVLSAFSFPVFSQEFAGLKIDGWYFDFKPRLETKGFQPFLDDSLLFHRFSWSDGNLDTAVTVYTTPKTHTVWQLKVTFRTHLSTNDSTAWLSLKSEYETVRAELVKKYGTPKSDIRTFSSPYDTCRNCKFYSTYVGNCNFVTIWNVDGGVISENMEFGQVCIRYQNMTNSVLYNKEKPADWADIDLKSK